MRLSVRKGLYKPTQQQAEGTCHRLSVHVLLYDESIPLDYNTLGCHAHLCMVAMHAWEKKKCLDFELTANDSPYIL